MHNPTLLHHWLTLQSFELFRVIAEGMSLIWIINSSDVTRFDFLPRNGGSRSHRQITPPYAFRPREPSLSHSRENFTAAAACLGLGCLEIAATNNTYSHARHPNQKLLLIAKQSNLTMHNPKQSVSSLFSSTTKVYSDYLCAKSIALLMTINKIGRTIDDRD